MDYVIGAFFLLIWAAILGAAHINNKTYNQRSEIMFTVSMYNRDMISEKGPNWYFDEGIKLWDDLHSVSYDKHMLYLLTFRNPYTLYPQRIRDILNGTVSS